MTALCALYAGALDDRIRSTVCERKIVELLDARAQRSVLHGANISSGTC